jgi:toxin ParE1/3/4
MAFRVVFTPYSEQQLQELYTDIMTKAGPATAIGYIERVTDYCLGLDTFPRRGRLRDDIRPGLRILGFERRITIAYAIEGDVVLIHGIFYGGQDFEEVLRDNIR